MPLEALLKGTDNDNLFTKNFLSDPQHVDPDQWLTHLRKHLQLPGNGEEILTTQISWHKHIRVRNMRHRSPLKCHSPSPASPHAAAPSSAPPLSPCAGGFRGCSAISACNPSSRRGGKNHQLRISQASHHALLLTLKLNKPNQILSDLTFTSGSNVQLLPFFPSPFPLPGCGFIHKAR